MIGSRTAIQNNTYFFHLFGHISRQRSPKALWTPLPIRWPAPIRWPSCHSLVDFLANQNASEMFDSHSRHTSKLPIKPYYVHLVIHSPKKAPVIHSTNLLVFNAFVTTGFLPWNWGNDNLMEPKCQSDDWETHWRSLNMRIEESWHQNWHPVIDKQKWIYII